MADPTGDPEQALTPEMVLWAYARGFFPMAERRDGMVHWYSADPRSILPLDGLRVPRSLRRRVQRGEFLITFDRAFEHVIRACAEPRPYAEDTWINDEIIETYTQLHTMGFAHSVEAWLPDTASTDPSDASPQRAIGTPHAPAPAHTRMMRNRRWRLVGGLYGVAIGAAFFGESMFSRATDASKVCLVHLVQHLRERGFTLLDTQLANEHMMQFGIVEVDHEQYMALLADAIDQPARW